MRIKWFSRLILLSVILVLAFGFSVSAADKPFKLRLSMQPTPEAFIVWRMMEEGLDKKAGLEFELLYFDSGASQIEALPAKAWDLANLGGVPTLMGALRYQIYMLAMSADDGYNNMIIVRPDSPILKDKGKNPKYPNLYGSAESVKGKKILVPMVTSAHYALSGWLGALGLMDNDVVIENLEPGQAISAFESGVGDAVSVWVPFSLTAIQKGWPMVADGAMTGASVPLVWIVPKQWGDENEAQVKKFIKLYFEQTDRYLKDLSSNKAALTEQARGFFKKWAGMEMEKEMMSLMLDTYKMFNMQQNMEMMDASKGDSKSFLMMKAVAEFFTQNKRFKADERDKVLKTPFITDKFLK
ncbi:MAG: ABC transporter substrate-binding protein [Deltaproteobacteria bacterium]|nr:ABC transporter substrate-binding protein [Deltaproteobacteria bacterium]